ncbi:MAG: acetyl-CoA carboxylase carboxyltransferase subunit alpha [bacterium]
MSQGTAGWLDFEKPLVELEQKIAELRDLADGRMEASDELTRLESKAEKLRSEIFTGLTRWQRVQLARHPRRPYTLDFIERLVTPFLELKGDRGFANDQAIVAGLGAFRDRKVVVIGHQKGRDIKEKLARNFGMPHPEGYRKALRLMQLAGRFRRPVITLIDTQGAYPGIGAEERGQSEAIAKNLLEMSRLPVPIVGVVIGEGGSGGALALGVCDRVYMLENSVYSVISPEGCAAILWGDRSRAPEAADSLRLTATDLTELRVIDGVIREPAGGAHRDYDATAEALGEQLETALRELEGKAPEDLIRERRDKFLAMGRFETAASPRS